MLKRIIAYIGLIVSIALLPSCRKEEAAPPIAIATPQAEQPQMTEERDVVIHYAAVKDFSDSAQDVINSFNESQNEIFVKYIELPAASYERYYFIKSSLDAGEDIDVFELDFLWLKDMVQIGYAANLDGYLQQDQIDTSLYYEQANNAARFNGSFWALPKSVDIGFLYMRADIVNTAPKSFDELEQLARIAQGKQGTKYGYVFQPKQDRGIMFNTLEFVYSYGGRFFDGQKNVVLNSPMTLAGLKKFLSIYQSDFVPTHSDTIDEKTAIQMFIDGQTVFLRAGSEAWTPANASGSAVSGKIAIAPLPVSNRINSQAMSVNLMCINQNSDQKEAAWEFLKYACGYEGQKISAIQGGRIPALSTVLSDKDVLARNPHFGNEVFAYTIQNARPFFSGEEFYKMSSVIEIIEDEVLSMLNERESPEQVMINMNKSLQREIVGNR